MINNQQSINLLHLVAFPSFGPIRIKRLEKYFPNLSEVFKASLEKLKLSGINENLAQEFINWRNNYSLNNLLNQLEQENIAYVCWHDKEYPKLLLETDDPPPILFYQGDISIVNQINNFLAIIGSRNNTTYGEKIILEIIPTLIQYNFIITSGLAFGIDALAHKQTLIAGGKTIAVLGSGLQKKYIYPRRNRELAQQIIIQGGLIVSEFLPDSPAQKSNFPRRNRIISGLSQAILIIEAEKKSGSLITASHALDQNRDILAIPGNIFSSSSIGTNDLIKKGAKLITNINDILENFKLEPNLKNDKLNSLQQTKYQPRNETENQILSLIYQTHLKGSHISTNEIIKKTKLDTSKINSTLSILEISGAIKNHDGFFEPEYLT
jgi:DNA processing protein